MKIEEKDGKVYVNGQDIQFILQELRFYRVAMIVYTILVALALVVIS